MPTLLKTIGKWTARLLGWGLAAFAVSVVLLKWVPPLATPLQLWRLAEAPLTGHRLAMDRDWVSYDEVSPHVYRAIIGLEDGRFLKHHGVDWKAVDHARRVNPSRTKRGKPPLGASTISMQCARNVYLLPIRFYLRKVLEAGIAYAIDFVWGKRRILEMYVNVIEWGDGVYGVQAAAQRYFHKDAADLSKREAALLAAVIQNPRRFHADRPSPYIQRRVASIMSRMGGVALP